MAITTHDLPGGLAAHSQDGGWWSPTTGQISGSASTLLIDTPATQRRTEELLELVRRTAAASAPHILVCTHAHGDHVNGARLLAEDGAPVYATAAAAREIAAGPHLFPSLFDCCAEQWGDVTPPCADQITPVTEPVVLDLGGVTAEIVPAPVTAHTTGDLVVFVPEAGVLFAGDLLFNNDFPMCSFGSVSGWITVLDWLRTTFEPDVIVPGHGDPAGGGGRALISAQRAYLQWVVDATAPPEKPDVAAIVAEATRLWPMWGAPERTAVNVLQTHAQTHAYELNIPATMAALTTAAGVPKISLAHL